MLDALVRKYTEIALNAKSVREAKSALDIAERAHKMLCADRTEEEKKAKLRKAPKNLTAQFISHIEIRTERAELFRMYVDYCSANGFEPARKSDFFAKLALYGYKLSRTGGGYHFTPPKVMTARLRMDAELN